MNEKKYVVQLLIIKEKVKNKDTNNINEKHVLL